MNESNLPLVSIITVCYNSEKTIGRTIQSVLNQTYSNIEYIIVDGDSTDNTLAVIDRYSEKFGNNLLVVSEKDSGIYDAMNKGIRRANGLLIGIINSDDWYEKTAVEQMVKAWEGSSNVILYGMVCFIEKGIRRRLQLNFHEDIYNSMVLHPGCFVTREVYQQCGLYDTAYKSIADYDFLIRAYDSNNVIFKPVYSYIANFSDGGMSSSRRADVERLDYQRERGIISTKYYWMKRIYKFILRVIKR